MLRRIPEAHSAAEAYVTKPCVTYSRRSPSVYKERVCAVRASSRERQGEGEAEPVGNAVVHADVQ